MRSAHADLFFWDRVPIGYSTRSPYECSHHVRIARDFGVKSDDIREIVSETNGESTSFVVRLLAQLPRFEGRFSKVSMN